VPIRAGDVVWLLDPYIDPEKRKMMVCVAPRSGLFFRINTEDYWPVAVPIDMARHRFLRTDSFVECSLPLEFDDYDMNAAAEEGVIGQVQRDVARRIWQAVDASAAINATTKRAIRNAFQF
jgi:hypothetical protein